MDGVNGFNDVCYDAGAVQTRYSLAFLNEPSTAVKNTVVTPAPTVQLYESGKPFANGSNAYPVTLTLKHWTSSSAAFSSESVATASNYEDISSQLSREFERHRQRDRQQHGRPGGVLRGGDEYRGHIALSGGQHRAQLAIHN